jgi:DNA-binding NarL/FixJ family response regulator
VLLLEDDLSTRELLTLVLAEEGVQARVCESPEQAIQAARDLAAPLLIADFWGSSHQILSPHERAQIRHLAEAVPTIMLTARAWAAGDVAADLGLVALVRKPFEIDEIRVVVAAWAQHVLQESVLAIAQAQAPRIQLDRAMDRVEAASTALRHAARRSTGAGLTRREHEVTALVAAGLTNGEIGERLVVTPGTVANHIRHISLRLGLRNRVQLAVWAVEHGLYRSDVHLLADEEPQPGYRHAALPAASVDGAPYG